MNARVEAVRNRAKAEILEACADQQERLAAAREAYEADPTEEHLAELEAAMRAMHEFRRWLREGGRPVAPAGATVVEAKPIRAKARVKRVGG